MFLVLLVCFALITDAMHDGRLCCRVRDKQFHPTGIVYIEPLNSIFAVDPAGYTQIVNRTDSTCGEDGYATSARYKTRELERPWGALNFQGATTKGDAHIAYILEGGQQGIGPAKIHFFDLDAWDIVHTVPLPDFPVNTEKGAGAITWIPDGHHEGRFLVGSHINGVIYAYRISSDRRRTDVELLTSFTLDNTDGVYDLSGLAFDAVDSELWSQFHKDSWTVYVHHVENGEVKHYKASRAALANVQGGSPPFKHEGIAVMDYGGRDKIWIADQHRYFYEILWDQTGRWNECPWVQRRRIGCCFPTKPCQIMAEEDCRGAGGKFVGKGCNVNTCVATYGPSVAGCPNSTYFPINSGGDCWTCSTTSKGGMKGCYECAWSDPSLYDTLLCTNCHDGYYLDATVCYQCDENGTSVTGIPLCASCVVGGGNSLTCSSCRSNAVLEGNACVSCTDALRGTSNCATCSLSDDSSITCNSCDSGFYLSNNNLCVPCSDAISNCATCANDNGSVTCNSCGASYLLYENACFSQCPNETYATRINFGQEKLTPIEVCEFCEPDNLNKDCYAYRFRPFGRFDVQQRYRNLIAYRADTKCMVSQLGTYDTDVGDLDGDGNLDVVGVNFLSNSLTVFLGDGEGKFDSGTSISTGASPTGVSVGHLNADQKLDVVVANFADKSLSIFIGNGDGSFAPAVNYPLGVEVFDVVVGDVTGDGVNDLVVSDTIVNLITVLEGTGSGAFVFLRNLNTGTNPRRLALANIDSGGVVDIVVANQGDNNVGIFFGNGDGTFSTQSNLAAGAQPFGISAGDVNGDGRVDIVATCTAGDVLNVFHGYGNGTFAPATSIPVGQSPQSVTLGDFNGDGRTDIGVSNSGDSTVAVVINEGAISMKNATVSAGLLTLGISTGDFNGDGLDDMAVAAMNSNSVCTLITHNPEFSTQSHSVLPTKEKPYKPVLADINGDGVLDLLMTNYGNNTISVSFGLGDFLEMPIGGGGGGTVIFPLSGQRGKFMDSVEYATGSGPTGIAVGNFTPTTGDGMPDIAVTNILDDTVSIFINLGNGTFAPQVSYGTGKNPFGIVIADLNTDGAGYDDLIISDFGGNSLTTLWGMGDGTFVYAGTLVTGVQTRGLDHGDLNGDGVFDLVCANQVDNNIGVFIGLGGGAFSPIVTYPAGNGPIGLAVKDLNGDGKMDIVACNFYSDDVSVLLGNGDGTFATQKKYATGLNPFDVNVADFNGDSKVDIVATSYGDNSLNIFLGNGDGTFQEGYVVPTGGSLPVGVTSGDLNVDGAMDILVSNFGSSTRSVFFSFPKRDTEITTVNTTLAIQVEVKNPTTSTLRGVGFENFLPSKLQGTLLESNAVVGFGCKNGDIQSETTSTIFSLADAAIPPNSTCFFNTMVKVVETGVINHNVVVATSNEGHARSNNVVVDIKF